MTSIKMTDIDPALALKILNVKLGSILKIAEEKYGIRDTSYSICGVSYTEEGFPHTWFPFLSSKVVGIRVMDICKNDINRGLYQLAHEIIHCLCPHRGINANVFEEGLATHFAAEYMDEYEKQPDWHPAETDYKYVLALKCIKKAFEIDPNIVTKLVAKERNFVNITEDMILEVSPEFPRDLAKILTTDFDDNSWMGLANKIE